MAVGAAPETLFAEDCNCVRSLICFRTQLHNRFRRLCASDPHDRTVACTLSWRFRELPRHPDKNNKAGASIYSIPAYLRTSYTVYLHTFLYFRICNVLAAYPSTYLRCKMPLVDARNMGSHSIARTVCSISGPSLVKTKQKDRSLASDSICNANSGFRLLTIAQYPLISYYPALRNDDHAAVWHSLSRLQICKQYLVSSMSNDMRLAGEQFR